MIAPLLLPLLAYATIAGETRLARTNWNAACTDGVCRAEARDDWMSLVLIRDHEGTRFTLHPLACAKSVDGVEGGLDAFQLRPQGSSYARAADRLSAQMIKLHDRYLDRCGAPYRKPSALYDARDLSLFLINTDRFVAGGSV